MLFLRAQHTRYLELVSDRKGASGKKRSPDGHDLDGGFPGFAGKII